MAAPVHVTSIDALGAFRSRLIIFLSTATRSLDEVNDEVRRTRQWLRGEQRMHWEGELRRRQKKLDAALQELMGARMSSLRETSTGQQSAVTKARAAMHEAEEKLRRVKYWNQNFDLAIDPIAKRLGGLRSHLDHDIPKAIAYLANAQRALDAYSEKMGVREPEAPAETTSSEPEVSSS